MRVLQVVIVVGLVVALAGSVCGAKRDLYEVLGVKRGASKRELKRAYRRASRDAHPDNNPDDPNAEAKFMELARAHEVLTDDALKQAYDRGGHAALEQAEKRANGGGGGGGFNPFDIFGFGGGNRGGNQEKRGPNVEIEFEVALEDLYVGTDLEAQVAKQVLCSHCDGSGAEDPDDVATCPVCKGRGVTITRHQMAPGFVQQMQTTCNKCGGKGKIVKSVCSVCGGRKVVPGSSVIDLIVDRGAPDGLRIEFPMESDHAPDTVPGDIIFIIRSAPHATFTRDANQVDLHTAVTIPLLDALVGFESSFAHLDGHLYTVANPGITKPGHVIKVPGQGMPHHSDPDTFGDLYVTVNIAMPDKLSSGQKDQLRTILG